MNANTTTDTHSYTQTYTHANTMFFWYMQSHFKTLSHILLDNIARVLLNDARIWKTSNHYYYFFFSLLKKSKEMSKEENTKEEEAEEEIFCCHWLWLYTSVESCNATMISWLLLLTSHLRCGYRSNVYIILPIKATLPFSATHPNLQSPDIHRNTVIYSIKAYCFITSGWNTEKQN